MTGITVSGADDIGDRLAALPALLQDRLAAVMNRLSLALYDRVQDKLHGEVLQLRTGTLSRSITASVAVIGTGFVARIGIDTDIAPYGPAQEFGATIPAHLIAVKNAKALSFVVVGGRVFARSVQFPGARLPERSFLRSSFAEMLPELSQGFADALDGLAAP